MNQQNHHPPQPPPPHPPPATPLLQPIHHQSATQIFTHATKIVFSHLIVFLFLSSLVFTFRSSVQYGVRFVSSFVDREPSIKALLSRLDVSSPYHHRHPHPHHRHRRRRPFLHVTRVGTLDGDFFSSDSDLDRSLFNPIYRSPPNASFLILSKFKPSSGFSHPIIDNGVVFPKIIRNGAVSFRPPLEETIHIEDTPVHADYHQESNNNKNDTTSNDTNSTTANASNDIDDGGGGNVVDLRFLFSGLGLGRRDATTLFYVIGILSAVYGYMILSFLVTLTWVYGILFVQVVDHLLGNYRSIFRTVWDGSGLGLRRLAGFVLMRWAVRDAMAQIMGIYFFREVEDQHTFFKIFIRMKLMPFSDVAPWVKGYERESAGFILVWFFVEVVVGFVFAVDSWVAVVDSRKSGREVMREGCHLLVSLLLPSLEIKCWEAMACGIFTRWMLKEMFGDIFALFFQSVMEIFFMAVWLVFYLAARHKDATLTGRTFGRTELEGFLEGIR